MEPFHFNSTVFLFLVFLAFSLFLDLSLVNAVGHCLQEESSSLLQLKRGFSFSKLDTWQSGTDCCIWEGVTCDKSRRVTGLDLSKRGISGKIDPSLFNLTFLRNLDLSLNAFGKLPIPNFGWDKLANLSSLDLSDAGFSGKVPDGISHLTKLESLYLSFNHGLYLSASTIFLQNMSNLRELYLDEVNISAFNNEWCSSLVNSTPALEALSMFGCSLFGASCSSLSKLPYLSILNLDGNNLDSSILNSFVNLTSLSELRLAGNEFKGVFPKKIMQLKNLEFFDISINPMLSGSLPDFSEDNNLEILYLSLTNFSGDIPNTIGNLQFLTDLDLSGCQFSGTIPSSIGNLSQLQLLDLSENNKLYGQIPRSLFQISGLIALSLAWNNFDGVVELDFIKNLKNLFDLDLSNSGISLSTWDVDDGSLSSFFPNISFLGLATCNLTKIPGFLKYQHHLKFMQYLDLSNNKIHGEIPSLIWSIPFLNLSHNFFTHVAEPHFNLYFDNIFSIDLSSNMLEGHLPPLPKGNLHLLDFSNNRFTSFISSNISSYSSLYYISFANNSLTGEIPTSICNLTELNVLDLSNNKLIGTIPSCLLEENSVLSVLDLSGNQLNGTIPHRIILGSSLQIINLRDNQLEGMLPRSLTNCQFLDILDLGNNNLKDAFPYWLGNLSWFRVLVLRSNKFYGLVGPPHENHEINHTFHMLHILDISSNNFSGNLCAEYFNNFKLMMKNGTDTMYYPLLLLNRHYYSVDAITIIRKGQVMKLQKIWMMVNTMYYPSLLPNYHYYSVDAITIISKGQVMKLQKIWMMVKSIDFSNNHFEGEIPISISQLISLQVLNLSQNYLTGEIPSQLGKLSQLESLDLSMNCLVGKIPQDLVSLYFLSYLNLSYNKLVGQIPSGGQFSTFPNTSFEGNKGLCRFPCNTSIPTVNNTMTSASKNESYMIVLGILFGVGFGVSMAIVILIDVIWCDKSRKRRNRRTIHG